jgi:hypothetical protein
MNKLTEIKESLSKITQGEWYSTDDAVRITPHDSKKCVWICQMFEGDERGTDDVISFENGENNAKFIADAPDYIKHLLSLLEEKDKALKGQHRYFERISVTFGEFECHRLAKEAMEKYTSSNNEGEKI